MKLTTYTELVRNMCPKKGSSIESITISIQGKESITLTQKDRDNLTKYLRHVPSRSKNEKHE